ncbi:hypothetical protein ScPMuIL_011989 [Solemya velum]
MRHFVNNFEDLKPGSVVDIDKEEFRNIIDSLVTKYYSRRSPPDRRDGGLYVGSPGIAYALFHLSKQEHLGSKRHGYQELALKYLEGCLNYKFRDPPSSFMSGAAGFHGVAAMIYKACGDSKRSDEFSARYASVADGCMEPEFHSGGSDEFFLGRAGYLCGILALRKELGKQVVDDATVNRVCSVMVKSGRDFARQNRSKSPLMYAYHGKQYLGAAHGLCSILQMLSSFPGFLKADPSAEQDIKQSVDFMLSLEQPNSNYPSSMEKAGDKHRRPEGEQLVHWCHGAPGVVHLFAKAYKVWGEEKYLQACLRCGELIWQRGLLHKGPGICHGVAGNGYVFLLLFRLTGDQKHLHRALRFAEFLFTPEFQETARTPDSPLSLYEGWAGTLCFLADLLNPEKAQFPFFDTCG